MCFLWETFASRYKDIPGEWLSFDLSQRTSQCRGTWHELQEPCVRLIRRTVAAIRSIDPPRDYHRRTGRRISAMPELADLGVTHSGRGYHPMPVSHHQASWWAGHLDGSRSPLSRAEMAGSHAGIALRSEVYRPWREVEKKGAGIHIGEFGCFNRTPNDIAIRWFTDLLQCLQGVWLGLCHVELPGTVWDHRSWPVRRQTGTGIRLSS